jgi:hypothetical protein
MLRPFVLGGFVLAALATSALAPAHAQKKSGLVGTNWNGRENLAGYGALTFTFEDDGNVTMIDAKETVLGRYTRNGQAIVLNFFNGQAIYSGRINGKTISGTARNARSTWTWSVTKEEDLPPETETKPAPEKKGPPSAGDAELKAADLLEQARKAAAAGNTTLARVRCRYIISDYPETAAAKEAKKLLDKLAK